MDKIADSIEHTVLGPTTTWNAVRAVLDDAEEYGMRACVPPCFVDEATEYAPETAITTVVGFPHGQHTVETKCTEATQAWKSGAAEIDVVARIDQLQSGEYDAFRTELTEVVAAVPIPVKVIVEAPLIDEQTLHDVGEIAAETDIAYLKTATGFADGGATVDDVAVMSEYCEVKASGGVGSWEFARELFDAGASRIGASSGDVIVREFRDQRGDS